MDLKLIVALDFACLTDALHLVDQLDPKHCALKVGSEMFSLFGPDFVRTLVRKGFKVFLDLKFYDIPNTVAQACKACAELEVWMINLHASGGLKMMQAAKDALESYGATRPLLIAVTVLTSMNSNDLSTIGCGYSLEEQVKHLAKLAQEAGLDGVVCSAHEVPMIKQSCGEEFLTITPGIRLEKAKSDDQARIMTPKAAAELGSDFLVIGRPITTAADPLKMVEELCLSLANPKI